MTRREARETLFSLIYETEFQEDNSFENILNTAKEARDLEIDDYIEDSFLDLEQHLNDVDGLIEQYAHGWKIDRISGVSRAILRLCIYEIKYNQSIPASVAINEAVELAKKFDDEKAPAFINGITNACAKAEGGMQ